GPRTNNAIELVRDLKYERTRHLLDLRAEFGVLWDVSLFIAVPLVLGDSRSLSFDQDGPCTFPPAASPSCVNQANSTTLNDAVPDPARPTLPRANAPTILPNGSSGWGLNATGRAPALYTAGTRVFEGPGRSGIESLNFGINWAVLNQAKDDTKPTWTVGFEARLQVSDTQALDRASPQANTAVGLGYHVARWQSFVSKRFRRV